VSQASTPAPAGAAPPFDPPFVLPASVELREGVVFAEVGGQALECQLFLPRARPASPRPGIVYVHGGGWRGRANEGKGLWRQAAHLAALGYPGVNLTHRFAPAHRFPAQLEDLQAGVRWVRAHAAALGVDPRRIGAVGESSGGHLAALLGTTDASVDGVPSRVQAVVAGAAVFDLLTLTYDRVVVALEALLGGAPHAAPEGSPLRELARAASPLHRADAGAAPTLLLQGTADQAGTVEQAVRFRDRLLALDVRCELHTGQGGGHGHFQHPPYYAAALEQTTAFLVDVLGA
jgi:acetyl esterase/lipase